MDPSAMGDGDDLVGDIGGSSNNTSDTGANSGALAAVQSGVDQANGKDNEKEREMERKLVASKCQEYSGARDFDKSARAQYAQDRKVAGGKNNPTWASDANLTGSFIDILTAFLYAQNPDVSAEPAEVVGDQPGDDAHAFAETSELVVSRLWKGAHLKPTAKRQVRSGLTVGIGWFKGLMFSQKRPAPQVEQSLHDAQAQLERIQAMRKQLDDPDYDDPDPELTEEKMELAVQGLQAKLMKNQEVGLSVDFCRAEDIQVSLDVSFVGDYLKGDWMSEDVYIPKSQLEARFSRLDAEDCRKAALYYQKAAPVNSSGDVLISATGEEASMGTFSKTAPNTMSGNGKPVEFAKFIEFWDRRDGMIYTWVDGTERWAVEPYPPPQASTRYYPYFAVWFYPVDGDRHPQSLTSRLAKLQDEYAACRSNQRLTRERSIPGYFFNAGQMSPEAAKKIEDSVVGEMVGLQLTNINEPIQNAIMAKPLPTINVALWDTSAIKQDMEVISGVQEALAQEAQGSSRKTATEAQIEQSGFASRTGADRDQLEEMLNDFSLYTLETALQELQPQMAQRIAGPKAYWPFGMDIQDLLTLVQIEIEAGTTGKPNLALDKANWATILPLLQKLVVQIRQIQGGDPALATALENLLRESLKRMDDRLDITQFIAQGPPPAPPPPPVPVPSVSVSLKGEVPPLDASMIAAKAAGLPPEAALADGGATPTAISHAGGIPEGEIPPHPLMPEPLPDPKPAPHTQGKMS